MDKIEIRHCDAVEKEVTYMTCTVCGDDKYPIAGVGGSDEIFVCESCMEDGDLDASLEEHAQSKEWYAKRLRGLIGKLVVVPEQEKAE
jgi:hypothetical protein